MGGAGRGRNLGRIVQFELVQLFPGQLLPERRIHKGLEGLWGGATHRGQWEGGAATGRRLNPCLKLQHPAELTLVEPPFRPS